MADKIKAVLLRPLNGEEIGTEVEYDKADFERLESYGAVERAGTKKVEPAANKQAKAPANKSSRKGS